MGEPFCAVFQKNSVSEKLMDKSGWGSIKTLPSETFCLIVLKFFVGATIKVSLIPGFEKSQGYEKGAENTNFRRNCFVSQYLNVRHGNF